MMSPVDYTTSSSVWTQTDKWKGRMDVRWVFVKDIPNSHLRHIRVWNNENKPVTNSRDTQELPPDAGLAMLRIFSEFPPKTSVILSNLVTAEIKEESNSTVQDDSQPSLQSVDEVRQFDNHRHGNLSSGGEEYWQDVYLRQSWQSSGDGSTRQSYQFDQQRQQNPALSRRNTISTSGPIGTTTNRMSASATPTSGMRSYDNQQQSSYLSTASRFHESDNPPSNTYRTMASGFTGVGDIYASNRYSTFHERNGNGNIRYDEEPRYF